MIRSKWEIPSQLFEAVSGKLGNSSGEDLKVAQAMYNQTTAPIRELYETAFAELFDNYKTELSVVFEIMQYSILAEDGTIKEGEATGAEDVESSEYINAKAQANLRGSVGGVTAILAIQSSVSSQLTDYDSGITMLKEIYGYSEEVARSILGIPKIKTEI
jgi:hypothetical protein